MKIPSLKEIAFYGTLGIATAAGLSSCSSSKHLGNIHYEQVNQFTSDIHSQPYAEISKLYELVQDTVNVSKHMKDNDRNDVFMYQVLAKNVYEYSPVKKGEVTEKAPKQKKHTLQATPFQKTDSMDIVATIKKVTTPAEGKKEAKTYFLLEGTNFHKEDYSEVLKVNVGKDGKISTNPSDWKVGTFNIGKDYSSGLKSLDKLSDAEKNAVENRINFFFDVFNPYSSPATGGVDVLIGKGSNYQENSKPTSTYKPSSHRRSGSSHTSGNGLFK